MNKLPGKSKIYRTMNILMKPWRTFQGGSYDSGARWCHSSSRDGDLPQSREVFIDVGFRIVNSKESTYGKHHR